jgi:hypothetical protein
MTPCIAQMVLAPSMVVGYHDIMIFIPDGHGIAEIEKKYVVKIL